LRPSLPVTVATLVPILLAVAFAISTWQGILRGTEAELRRTSEAAAEYVRRVLDGYRLGADRVNDLLRGLTDAEILAREPELQARLRALMTEMPQVRTAHVVDREGRLLLSATDLPTSREIYLADREWHAALARADAPPVLVSRVHVAPADGRTFFVVARRRSGSANPQTGPTSFDGVTSVSLGPAEMANGLRTLLRNEATDRLGLFRSDGEEIADTGAGEEQGRFPPLPATGAIRAAIAEGGDDVMATEHGDAGHPTALIALRRVRDYPFYVSASRPIGAMLARWWRTVSWPFALAFAAAVALGGLTLLLLRGRRALEASHQALEARAAERTAELANALDALRQGEARLRLAVEAGGFGTWETDMATGRSHWDARLASMLGLPEEAVEVDPLAMESFIHPEDRPRAAAEFAAALHGQTPFASEFRCIDAMGQERWLLSRGQPARDADGAVRRIVGLVQDVTERRRGDAARDLLLHELAHRVKNALALVQAMSDQTLRATADDPRRFAPAFRSRLQAMARAHDLLTARSWDTTPLAEVVSAALAPWVPLGARLEMEGPTRGLALSPQQAQSLVLGLHELATNAAKSGSLSTPAGRVTLRWKRLPDGWAELEWQESGGPPIEGAPPHHGFGMRLLQRGLARGLGPGAGVKLHFEPTGLRARIRFRPLGQSTPPLAPSTLVLASLH
jgi:PAS domain S-box-containing protein